MCLSIIQFIIVGTNEKVCVYIYVYICLYAYICTRMCTCLLSIRISLACARASKLTTTNMYVCEYVHVCMCVSLPVPLYLLDNKHFWIEFWIELISPQYNFYLYELKPTWHQIKTTPNQVGVNVTAYYMKSLMYLVYNVPLHACLRTRQDGDAGSDGEAEDSAGTMTTTWMGWDIDGDHTGMLDDKDLGVSSLETRLPLGSGQIPEIRSDLAF